MKESKQGCRPRKAPDSRIIKKGVIRILQRFIRLGMCLTPWPAPKVMQGPGSVRNLPLSLKKMNLKKPLIVTGKTVRGSGLLNGMLETMESIGIPGVIFDGVKPNPTNREVEAGVSAFRENRCDCLIAFGGGSPMDCAKAIGARIARPGKTVPELQGMFRVLRPTPVIFAVPTTAGTGSETTIAAVITDTAANHKAAIMDLSLMPKFAVLDPELTVGLPPRTTAETGMDALCHAVEAYTNDAYNSRMEKELARRAVKLIFDNLQKVYENGTDLEARQKMQQAAFCAGRAFTRGCVGYVHAVGHPLSSLYGIPHGRAMGILLPHVMRAYGAAAHKRLAELSDVCGLTKEEAGIPEKAEAFIQWIEELKARMDIPERPDMIRREDVEQIAEWAEKEGNPLYPVPVIWSREEFAGFIRTLLTEEDLAET